jgi:3-hydroxyisobutyrate dehydrogenase-like beta-hydroxyacid dehydrogenase
VTAGIAPAALTVAVLGLGEAGGTIARDLAAAGVAVRGYDPAVPAPPGVTAAVSDADACQGADLVLSLTTANEAERALEQALPGLAGTGGPGGPGGSGPSGPSGPGGTNPQPGRTVYADANTASAGLKQGLAVTADEAGVPFADIALMAPVPGRGLHTPMVVSGPAAEDVARLLGACGATVSVLPGPAGAAATRKLLRSVFYKGMAAAAIEALHAARAAGCEDWLREHIAAELAAADGGTLARLEQGSYQHARQRPAQRALGSAAGDPGQPAVAESTGHGRLTEGTVRTRGPNPGKTGA